MPFLKPPGLEGDAKALTSDLSGGGRVIAAGAEGSNLTRVGSEFELDAILLKNRDKPVEIELKPPGRTRNPTRTPNRWSARAR